jgi:uncharacterized protein YecT (DUF1311 family)
MNNKIIAVLSAALTFLSANSALAQETDTIDQICKRVSMINFPSADRPSPEEVEQLKGCQSMKFYYGIGVAPDYEKARKCAFLEMASGDNLVFGGSSVLMMIYANGQGVKRNIDLSTQLACKSDAAPMESGERISHLQDLRKKPVATYQFDLCDDITSGYMQGNCADKDSKIVEAKLEAEINSLTAKWPQSHQNQFKSLSEAAGTFFETRIENEVDLSGTARTALQSEEKENLETDFTKALENFENGSLPAFSAEDYQKTAAELNDIYSSIIQSKNEDLSLGTVTVDKIKLTQKAWLRYCNAWIKFAAIRYPNVSVDSWKTWLDKSRIEQLRDFYS